MITYFLEVIMKMSASLLSGLWALAHQRCPACLHWVGANAHLRSPPICPKEKLLFLFCQITSQWLHMHKKQKNQNRMMMWERILFSHSPNPQLLYRLKELKGLSEVQTFSSGKEIRNFALGHGSIKGQVKRFREQSFLLLSSCQV